MPDKSAISWGRAIAWGAYLACSWTWCIGMFLPLLLVRDFGQAGWWAFAVPNVVGAAAMGWVLRSSLAASKLRAGHLWACRAFSLVTVGFHVFFLAWLSGWLFPVPLLAGVAVLASVATALVATLRERFSWVALLLWMCSAAVLVRLLAAQPAAVVTQLARPGMLPDVDVLWLSPVCAFGFALCPYLDLTFLRARRVCDGATGAAAFTIGFGLMFASMIVLTLGYASMLDLPIAGLAFAQKPEWARLAIVHIGAQAAFTIAVHVAELATPEMRSPRPPPLPSRNLADTSPARGQGKGTGGGAHAGEMPRPMPLGRVLLLVSVLASAALGIGAQQWPDLAGLTAGEVGYRVFMSAYGLAFPAYVWVCVVPRGRTTSRRAALIAWAAGVVAAAPFFAAGFLWRETVWLAPGLLVAMSSRWWVVRAPRNGQHSSPAARTAEADCEQTDESGLPASAVG